MNKIFGSNGCRAEDGVPDMTILSNIDEDAINKNLNVRYHHDCIYTYSGTILVAVNPYKELEIYTPECIRRYQNKKLMEEEPHIFAMAESSLRALQNTEKNQSCVISGESGAGKTETTKFLLQYLCSVTTGVSAWVEQQILEANTILEAFGNAKTVRNDNSSRFGKFMQVCFDKSWYIKGCLMQDYLLEQSRITFQGPQERNYHIFYQLVFAAERNKELSEQFYLESASTYKYLNQSGCGIIEGVDDAQKFDNLRLAFNVLHIPQDICDGIFSTISAILWLGNLKFTDLDGEKCELSDIDKNIIGTISKLLGLSANELEETVLQRQINIRGNVTHIPFKILEARENRHAMAKALYSRTFAWLVDHINKCTNPGQDQKRFLGVLDIFGFENFATNSFEQLCINYTNEKLHKFFNHYVFALEQEIYRQEEIKFSHIEFTDNTECLELLEKPPRCILKLISEECRMPKGSDKSYLTKLHQEFEGHLNYIKGDDRRRWELEFGIVHYAGKVIYTIDGFVDKNRDAQQDVFFELMTKSKNQFVGELTKFQDLLGCTIARMGTLKSTLSRGSTKGKPTVSDAFRNQLQALVDVLQSSNPWYVRCIKPNHNKAPDSYDHSLVLDQLRYLGMNDIIRIRREGFPVHWTFEEFVKRYFCLWHRRRFKDIKMHVTDMIKHQKFNSKDWQVGKTKVCLRQKVSESIEDRRQKITRVAALKIQTKYRMHHTRKDFLMKRNACIKIQTIYRSSKQRREFRKKRKAIIFIQAYVRGMFAREVANALREMKRIEEEERKREKLDEERKRREEEEAKKLAEDEKAAKVALEVESQTEDEPSDEKIQSELEALSDMVQTMNPCIAKSSTETSAPGNEADVDLDSIFDFLSKVQSERHPLDDTLLEMENLIGEVDEEIESLERNKKDAKNDPDITAKNEDIPDEKPAIGATLTPPPSLTPIPAHDDYPELPPPPPLTEKEKSAPDGEAFMPLPPPPLSLTNEQSQINGYPETNVAPKEPIYETIPSNMRPSLPREPNYISGPPPEGPPPAPPEQSIVSLRHAKEGAQTYPLQQSSSEAPPPSAAAAAAAITSDGLEPRREHSEKVYRHSSGQRRVSRSPMSHSSGRQSVEDPARAERRKQRVERKLNELEGKEVNKENDHNMNYDLIEFAEKFFNSHEKSPEGTIISTLRKRSSSSSIEYLPKYELITYSRVSVIPTSHVKLNDPENINIACTIFRDLCKYCRGEMKPEQEIAAIQSIISHGIEREELRNEIYIQCMRQVTNNPNTDSLERLWLLMCLCIVGFLPSKTLFKYFYSFLHKALKLDGKLHQYVQWCIDNCKNNRGTCRRLPPSSVEIAAMKKLGTIVCRFFFLDGRTKAIDVHPRDTAGDAMKKLAERLVLSHLDGWAIYESSSEGDKHVKIHEYLYDVISSWEKKQTKAPSGAYGTLGKKNSTSGAGENRFVFRKRLFRNPREIPSDPAEVNLLYAQAVYSVVRNDDYPINEKVALQLAGLQAQVALGDPQPGKTEFYADVSSYLPQRIAQSQKPVDWISVLSKAHEQYGTGKTDILAKVWYLTCVMQFPLYGTTLFSVSYRGYWSYGNTLLLGINSDGIAMIKPDDKVLLNEYRYCEIESIFLDPSDNFITFNLLRTLPDAHKCFVFETIEKEEIGYLVGSYSPILASWIRDVDVTKKVKHVTSEDRVRLYYNLVHSRRQIIDNELLRKPLDQGGNFIVSTLRRLNKQKLDKLRQDYGESIAENYKGFHHSFWAFSKFPLMQTLSKIMDPELESQALLIFQVILTYSGLNPQSEMKITSDDQQLSMIQSLLEKCMKNDVLLNEAYLQLIKQTNDHPDPNSRVNMRHWSLLTLFCSVIPPTDRSIRKYLRSHLQRGSIDFITEEGKYARYAEKCLLKALNNRRRQWPPSKQEILCSINRRSIYSRFHFMDGQFHSLEFEPSATASDVLELIKQKIGLKEGAKGYAIYEMLGVTERCLSKDDVLADVMSRWEKYRQATTTPSGTPHSHHIFLFKKHLLLEAWIDLTDPVEKELLYFQVLYSLRADKFPVTHTEAVMLCALRAQIELGNFSGIGMDYAEVIEHTLSPRLLTAVTHEAVSMQHQSLFNMDPQAAKESFLTLIKSFPLHRATIFDVTQSFTSNWPKVLWLALDEAGVHLLEHRSRNVLCTYEYSYILNYSASITALMIITGSRRKQSKVILNTTQAFMIATLIKDYSEVVLNQDSQENPSLRTSFNDGHPDSIMNASSTSLSSFITQNTSVNYQQKNCQPVQLRRPSRSTSLKQCPPPPLMEETTSK